MIPVTIFEKYIVSLNNSLPDVEANVIEWAKEAAVPHGAVRRKNNVVVCASCGNAMPFDPGKSNAVCLECGRVVRIVDSEQWKRIRGTFKGWFSILSVIKEVQLQRTFEIKCRYYLDVREPRYVIRELCRHWRTADGSSAVTALPRIMGQFVDCFPFNGKIELRRASRMVYDFIANNSEIYPVRELLPIYHRPGFNDILNKDGAQVAMGQIYQTSTSQE